MFLTLSSQSVATRVYGEDLIGLINSANVVFATSQSFVPGTEVVYFNGVRQREGVGNDYVRSESGGTGTGFDTITFAIAPRNRPGSKSSDSVTIDYDTI